MIGEVEINGDDFLCKRPADGPDRPVIPFIEGDGTAPQYAGLDKVSPSLLISSGALTLDHVGWREAAERTERGLERPFASKRGDL
jgi:isocitrate dehydrogenase